MKNIEEMIIENPPNLIKKGLGFLFLSGFTIGLLLSTAQAGQSSQITEYPPQGLSSSGWTITDEYSGTVLTNLTDNNPATYSTIISNPTTGVAGFVINLGTPTVVDRVYLTGPTTSEGTSASDGSPANWPDNDHSLPLGMIRVYVGNTSSPTTLVGEFMVPYDAGNPVDTEADIRFQPVVGQYVRVELQTAGNVWWNYQQNGNPGNWVPVAASTAVTLPWNVGEVEVHGFAGMGSITNKDAVLLPAAAYSAWTAFTPWQTSQISTTAVSNYDLYLPLIIAAKDLSYYLGKVEGNPVPIISSSQESAYSGTIYTIEDLRSLASNYATMLANEKNGSLPLDISVVQQGNQVQFSGWPYRNVLKSVWTFLAAQGVHWVYFSDHGDFIPATGSISLSMLPLSGTSIALSGTNTPHDVTANFDTSVFQPWPYYINEPTRQSFLNIWRMGWNNSWSSVQEMGGWEIPSPVQTSTTLSSTLPDDYSTGFGGYPHSMGSVVPLDVLQASPFSGDSSTTNWCGYDPTSATRICNSYSGALATTALPSDWPSWKPMVPDLTNPDLINWVAAKLSAYAAYAPVDNSGTTVPMTKEQYNLDPMDSTGFDQGPNSLQANSASASSVVPIAETVPWVTQYGISQSGSYYSFVNQVATQVASSAAAYNAANPNNPINIPIVGALAYSDVSMPPAAWKVPTLASNIRVDICQWGAPNLPISTATTAASPNYGMKGLLDAWAALAQKSGNLLGDYEYTPYTEGAIQFPTPAVAGIVDKAQYLVKMGALEGGTQAVGQNPYSPWNLYAFARIRQNTTLTASDIENEFFTSYFKEAAAPMLAYYQTMENWQVSNNVNLHPYGFVYTITPGAFPNGILSQMQSYLSQAQSAATSWIVKKRVADMVTGFNWILTQRNLGGANLSDTSPYQAVGVVGQDNQSISLSLENGVLNPPFIAAQGGSEYIQENNPSSGNPFCNGSTTGYGVTTCPNAFWSLYGGQIYLPINFVQSGVYQITLSAKGIISGLNPNTTWANPPQMTVYVGPQSFPLTISSTSPANYTITVNIPAGYGVQDIWLKDQNGNAVQVYSISVTRTGPLAVNYGDVNGDGSVTIYDAELAAQAAVNLLTLNSTQQQAAEVDGTGKLDIYDAFLIAEYAVNMITTFPVQG